MGLFPAGLVSASPNNGFTNSGHEWFISSDEFGPSDVDNDAYDGSAFSLSDDGSANWYDVVCVYSNGSGRTNVTELSGGANLAYCPSAWADANLEGLEVDMYSYVYSNGLMAATTYTISNTTGSNIDINWGYGFNYGEGNIDSADFSDIYSIGDGTNDGTTPAAVAWGPTSSSCSAATENNDGYDDMALASETCTVSANSSISLTFFHLIDNDENLSDLQADALAKFDTRNADSTLAAGIPAGAVAANWGITGTLELPNLTDTMTPSGNFAMGEYMTISFNENELPYGDYFDIWMCPTTDLRPVDGVEQGDCVPVTFWQRSSVANYDQNTSALTLTWQIANEDVAGLTSEGGAAYLDSANGEISVSAVDGDGGWCQYEGWYLIVNDYDSNNNEHGLHSNFSEPLSAAGCSEPAALADTGVDAQPTGLIGVFALVTGLAIAVVARRRNARSL